MLEDPKIAAKFKSSTAQQAQIARKHGKDFEVISENQIPDSIRAWLDKKGISYREIPWGR
ncbi:hypothetical protein Acsp04_05790 [Actinomadura sp. NBRC 104425]|nr:hypothetical protein Acsp04_05790 [Actinomadura sp. NBRC 104425]